MPEVRLEKSQAQAKGVEKEVITMKFITWDDAVSIIRSGGVVVYPTETCFGLGADATNEKAVERVFELKKRPKSKPISIAFSSVEMAKEFLALRGIAYELAKRFMPGPLTLVVNRIGFRVPDFDKVRDMIRSIGRPITATSANISGEPPAYRFDEIPDIAPVVKELPKGERPSTVFDVDKMSILREGPISKEEIMSFIHR